ncbi:MAG TPA: cupin domain-containing protein [Thermoleophilaceae bacterium]|nr:cupin domain-containing protein [Thermoleophilaceae bacterium]
MTATQNEQLLGPDGGETVFLGGLGVRFMIDAEKAGGGISLVEHPIAPRTLAAPLHRHANEDEYSYVLEGRVGVQLGDEVLEAGPGELVFKPRNQWHAFWNPGDEPARLLEFISPGGFEQYFADIAPLLPPNREEPDFEALAATQARYGLEMDFESIERLSREHGLTALE